MTHQYELMVILDPEIDERTVAPSLDKFLNVIRNDGGTVDNVDIWGRRRLAYEINKKTEGIYAVVNLTANASATVELDRQLKLSEAVMRTKVLRAEEAIAQVAAAQEARRGEGRPQGRQRRSQAPAAAPAAPPLRLAGSCRPEQRLPSSRWPAKPSSPSWVTSPATPSCATRRTGWRLPTSPSHPPRAPSTARRTTGKTATRSSSVQASGVSSPSTWPVRLTKGSRVIAHRSPQAALVRDERGREAHQHRARGRRDRPLASLRHRSGHARLVVPRRRRRRRRSRGGGRQGQAAAPTSRGPQRAPLGATSRAATSGTPRADYSDETPF